MKKLSDLTTTPLHISPLSFEQILRLPQKELKQALATTLKQQGYQPKTKSGFLYAPGTIPVLLVAHLDTVHRQPVKHICYSDDRKIVMSPEGIGGDDRCGVCMILEIIKKAPCHILFCEDEETGCVGARKFTKSGIAPQVHYIVEMDRRGANDAVFYHCENPDFTDFICSFGFQEAYGSCSDISYLAPYLKTAAVNISSGYYNEHRLHEHINLEQMKYNALRIQEIVLTKSEHFEYRERRFSSYFRTTGNYEEYTLWDYMDNKSDNRTPMMKLPEGSYVSINGQQMNYNEHYFIDRKGNVYDYLTQLEAAVPCEGMNAFTNNGIPVSFKPSDSRSIKVISLEKALELLQAG